MSPLREKKNASFNLLKGFGNMMGGIMKRTSILDWIKERNLYVVDHMQNHLIGILIEKNYCLLLVFGSRGVNLVVRD